MATKPTPGGSDGTYGTELNEFLDVSLASDGKIKDGAVFSTSAAPTVDAGLANKKYTDDRVGFRDRGDAAIPDFQVGDLITDAVFHDLDLSSIIASGAKSVVLRLIVTDDAAGSFIQFRNKDGTAGENKIAIRTQVSGVAIDGDIIVACDSSRVIQYSASDTTFNRIDIIVGGWWF